ncbi:MAG: tRNA (N6-isopentenyl adenosine(37)-C2)-methylthiotransferase MiaB [Flavobacteriales bacterium]
MQQKLEKEIDESRQGEALMTGNTPASKLLYIESYGCAMNFADSEIVASILKEDGFGTTRNVEEANVIFINTCSIRENAETSARNKLKQFNALKRNNPELVIGVLGCMAERLKSKFLEEEKLVDLVAGPDSYRTLPQLINEVESGQKAVNVLLSREETYADLSPVRMGGNGISAFVSIMRGCDNMCTFCVVPFTRGRERSRDPHTIVQEVRDLHNSGYKEVTLLGQNVDSYCWSENPELRGKALKEAPRDQVVDFAKLLEMVALVAPDLRVRFSTSHPKDITDEVLFTMKKHHNICEHIHLPLQSGNSRILEKMNRTYTREWFMDKVNRIREIIPGCGITTDVITGFCSETEEEHQDTVALMKWGKFDMAYMYYYSERPGTLAAKKYPDDVPEADKKRRLQEVIEAQHASQTQHFPLNTGKTFEVLVEGVSKKSEEHLMGRTTQSYVVIFPREDYKVGDYVNVLITDATRATLIGKAIK